jgi:hypothetical protein
MRKEKGGLNMKRFFTLLFTLSMVFGFTGMVYAWTPKAVVDDPLVRMPGTQPGQTALQAPTRCLNCHGGYDTAVEPGFNWKGSMMAQAARDFLFWSCLTVAAQDSIWAVGRPNAVDICERCHFPQGWLEGRSDPPNASAMVGADFDGVQCDFCHTMFDPFFETTYTGTREGNDWLTYWDETNASGTPSQPAADATYAEDMTQAQGINIFNGSSFFDSLNEPPVNYSESGSGQYFVSSGSQKRASFADAAARHQTLYSRYHKSKYFCDTCHDVSNPVLANLGQDGTLPLTTETDSAFSYFHVERTFSEFMLSAYGQQGGAPGMGPFAPNAYATSDPNNNIRMCQDCHMRDVVGQGCNKQGVPVRPVESVEHPESGQPLHDLTGGNAWVSWVLASAIPGSPNHDPFNDAELNKGAAVLTLDLTQGEGIDPVALLAGVDRSKQQLLLAASIENLTYDPSSGHLSFRVQNQTGHKLISGFPEGRRMFVNIKAKAGGSLVYEVNPYDAAAGTLKDLIYPYLGQGLPDPQPLGANEVHVDDLVYEMKPSSTDLTGEAKTFHFALGTGRYKDNRIPPKGFNIVGAAERHSVPVWHGAEDANYFTAAEYAGGYDEVSLTIAKNADNVEVNLYYQTTSREYIEFLRDEINGTGNLTLTGTGAGGDDPYIVSNTIHPQAAFFDGLRAWGNTIWNLWTHNMKVDGAAPFLMTSATVGPPPTPCGAPTPALTDALPVSGKVTLTWTGDPSVSGYNVYYDQAGKAQFLASVVGATTTTFEDAGLQNATQYCYKVTSWNDVNGDGLFDSVNDCESGFSNVLCAVPVPGGGELVSSVTGIETGKWITTGKGKNQATLFELTTTFNVGDAVVIRVYVVDVALGAPVSDATVVPELIETGELLNPRQTDVNGMAEFVWQTQKGTKQNPGTNPGTYTVRVTDVTATGYFWDGVKTTSNQFTIQ